MTDDDRLLAELAEAVRRAEEVPAGFVAGGKAAFAWRTIDAELAALTHDSATDPALAGTRAEPAELRLLTFVAHGLSIEIEVTAAGLLGQIVPPQAGVVELQNRDGSTQAVEADEVGWFVLRPAPRAMFRLRVGTNDGAAVVTPWLTL